VANILSWILEKGRRPCLSGAGAKHGRCFAVSGYVFCGIYLGPGGYLPRRSRASIEQKSPNNLASSTVAWYPPGTVCA
jgi:hypothetical protein